MQRWQAEETKEKVEEKQQQQQKKWQNPLNALPPNSKLVLLALLVLVGYLWMTQIENRTSYALLGGAVLFFVFIWGKGESPQQFLSDAEIRLKLYDHLRYKQAVPYTNQTTEIPRGQIQLGLTCDMHYFNSKLIGKKIAFSITDEQKLIKYYFALCDLFTGDILSIFPVDTEYDPMSDYPSVKTIMSPELRRQRYYERFIKGGGASRFPTK